MIVVQDPWYMKTPFPHSGIAREPLPSFGRVNAADKVCAPAFVGTIVLMKTHEGLLASAA
jgi:hypothetical protein